MTFVGIDPVGLVGLADTCGAYAERVRLVNIHSSTVLRLHWDAAAVECDLRLGGIVRSLSDQTDELRWRARVIAEAQEVHVGGYREGQTRWLAEFAATALFNLGDWQRQFELWNQDRFILGLRDASPQQVANSLGSLPPSSSTQLAERYPAFIGSLDGAPPAMRYQANAALIADEVARLEGVLAGINGQKPGLLPDVVAGVETRLAEYRRWLAEGRRILLFSPRDDGRVVEVFGDLSASDAVAVVVPGMANDIGNFSMPDGGFRANAQQMYEASEGSLATIAWLGYNTPDGVGAASTSAAEAGVSDLAQFLDGIDPDRSRHVTVVAHSYGSVLTGMAADLGVEVDDLVFVGSPGTTLDDATEAKIRSGGQVWVALADDDPIGLGIDPTGGFEWWHLMLPFGPALTIGSSVVTRTDLWHGTNPVAEEFGGVRISTDGSSGHSSYFMSTSLENLVLIATGRDDEVRLAD